MKQFCALFLPDLPALGIFMLAAVLLVAADPSASRQSAAAGGVGIGAPSTIDLERLAYFGVD